jgi:hypothetical protein
MGSKNTPGRYDCFGAAEPDEPMFILLGRDPDAPQLVRDWVIRRQARGEAGDKLMEALDCAAKMEAFRIERDRRPHPPIIQADD